MNHTRSSITVVVATYRRVDALKATLKSLTLQTHVNWDAIVVGDHCGIETENIIRSVGDPRIRYYNLPRRYGEQSGPNSFGLALAKGKYVAFLNHDDMLLQDHFQYGLKRLRSERADFFVGRFAQARKLRTSADGSPVPVFSSSYPDSRDLWHLMADNIYFLDPSSFWLVRRAYAQKVGRWLPARELFRTPLRDWLMRCWRQGGKFIFGDRITGLRFMTQNLRKGSPLYAHQSPEHAYMLQLLNDLCPDDVRVAIGWPKRKSKAVLAKQASEALNTPQSLFLRAAAALYLATGVDTHVLDCQRRGVPRGNQLNRLSSKRTGVPLPQPWDVSEALQDAESCRVI